MKMAAFAFGTTNWAEVERTEHKGETGLAYWRTRFFGEEHNQIRVRMVEYTPGYLADHIGHPNPHGRRKNSSPYWPAWSNYRPG